MMTAFYMSRVYFLTFWGKFRGTHEQEHHLHESPLTMTIPLMVLAVLSVVGGFLLHGYMEHNLVQSVVGSAAIEEHTLHTLHTIMYGVTAAVLAIAAYAYVRYVSQNTVPSADAEMQGFEKTVYNKYYVDELYENIVTKPLNRISSFFSIWFENNVVDRLVNGVGEGVNTLSGQFRQLQTGNTGFYIVSMVVGIVVMFVMMLFR